MQLGTVVHRERAGFRTSPVRSIAGTGALHARYYLLTLLDF